MMPFLFKLYCIMLRNKGIHFYLVLGLFVVYLINGLIAIPRNSVTYDEMDNWSYGKRVLMRKTDKVYLFEDGGVMPICGLNALPRAVQQLANPGLLKTDGGFSDIHNGRYVTLIVCLLTGFFIYRWSKELYGEGGGLLSLFLFVFCPNLNGHGILLAMDAYTALFTVSTAYYYWKFIKRSGWKYFLAFSLSLAMAQIAKYSMIHLVIFLGIVSIFVLLKRKTILSGFVRNFIRLLVMGVLVVFVINMGYIFNSPGKSLDELKLASKSFTTLQNSFIGSIPLPLPKPYIEGLDMISYMNELGAGHPNVSDANYLFGVKRTGTGFWYYYLVVFSFKTPFTSLLLLVAAVFFLFVRKKKQGHPSTMLFLLFFIFYFLLVLGIQNNVQIGIRHLIMVYPLLYVLAGFVTNLPWFQKRSKFVGSLIIAYSLFTYYLFFPNLISYSNELIIPKKNAYKVMADSNLDYGQGTIAANKFLAKNKDVKIADTVPAFGKFILGVNYYLDLKGDHKFLWLKNFKPVAHVNHCYLLFDIKIEDLEKIPAVSFNLRDSLVPGAN